MLYFSWDFFWEHPYLIFLSPLFGFFTLFVYKNFFSSHPTTKEILNSIRRPRSFTIISVPFIILFSCFSQIFGVSTGREGVAINYGVTLFKKVQDLFPLKLNSNYNELFTRCGIAAGFSSLFGVPWAGAFFAIESTPHQKYRWNFFIPSAFSGWIAFIIAELLKIHHGTFYEFNWSENFAIYCIKLTILGIFIGYIARFILYLYRKIEKIKYKSPYLTITLASMLLIICYLFSRKDLLGMGAGIYLSSTENSVPFYDFLIKGILTVFSSASGFKGGEMTPLFATGALFGSFIAPIIAAPLVTCTGISMVSLFMILCEAPLTAASLASELFGANGFFACLLVTLVGIRFKGKHHSLFSDTKNI